MSVVLTGRQAWRSVTLVIVGFVSNGCLGNCQCDGDEKPCLSGIDVAETYEVELVSRYYPQAEIGVTSGAPFPYDNYGGPGKPCGGDFDIGVGDLVRVSAKGFGAEIGYCMCSTVQADYAVPKVKFVSDQIEGLFGYEAEWAFRQAARVELGDDCSGFYEIGLANVYVDSLRNAGISAPTDYMLYRQFVWYPDNPCVSPVPENNICIDRWFVRIRDSHGRLISKDFPPLPDAGLLGAGVSDASDADGGV